MKKAMIVMFACCVPLTGAFSGGTFLGKDPEGDKKAAKDQAFGTHSAADANGDATITKDEWMAYLVNNSSAPAFEELDQNRDGKITTDEYESLTQDQSGTAAGGDGTAGKP